MKSVTMLLEKKIECLIVKMDFATSYDCVSWEYLKYLLGRINFGLRWLRWRKMLIFLSSMSVLINGSPTTYFEVGRRLHQGDTLSQFFIAAEGISGLIKNVIRLDKFHGFNFNEDVHFELIQFIDNIVLICNINWDNLWTIEVLFRGFELAFGLFLNLNKSKVFGINLEEDFLRSALNFLACSVGAVPFNFLGIQVGANPWRRASSNNLLGKMRKKIFKWHGKHMSIGSRVVVLNTILTNLPIFHLSFFKDPRVNC